MIKVALMIEGQDGLTWDRWKELAQVVQDLGFSGLFRSDHFTNARPPDKASLELWTSLTWLAVSSKAIDFGPLVTPLSFRHPALTARMAREVDDLSGGRLVLGLGAGWQAREHEMFGFNLGSVAERMDRLEEGVEVIVRLLRDPDPVSFHGKYFRLDNATLTHRPARDSGPEILLGGNGRHRTLPLAARWADEWNGVGVTASMFAEMNQHLDRACRIRGREPETLRRSIMVNLIFLPNGKMMPQGWRDRGLSQEDLRAQGRIVGNADQVVEQIGEYQSAGADRIMLQWLDQEDLAGLEVFAKNVLATFA